MFKCQKNLAHKNKNLSKDITFGTRKLLKEISFLHNDKETNKEIIEICKNAKEQAEILRMAGYDPSRKGINKNATKANHGGFKAYKNWMAD